MLIAYEDDGMMYSIDGFRMEHTIEMIDELQPVEGYGNFRIYDAETMERVWLAIDTGGTISVELDDDGNVLGVITENGELEAPEDMPIEPESSPIVLLQQENAELWHDSMMKDLSIGATMEETAELWHENMLLDAKLNDEMSALWYELMTGGI